MYELRGGRLWAVTIFPEPIEMHSGDSIKTEWLIGEHITTATYKLETNEMNESNQRNLLNLMLLLDDIHCDMLQAAAGADEYLKNVDKAIESDRLSSRGFSQAEFLSRPAARKLGELVDILEAQWSRYSRVLAEVKEIKKNIKTS